jgi:P-type Ca2+ transporter type 2C
MTLHHREIIGMSEKNQEKISIDRGSLASSSIAEVYTSLQTTSSGLTQTEAQERMVVYGKNALREVKGKPLYIKLLANFTHLMAVMLWIAGAAAFIAQMPQLGIAVWAVNIINGAFSFWQEFRAEKATEALKKLLPAYARVLRDGAEQKILAEELVPGDIILLGEGDSISADCRLVNTAELRCDQSTLTGESRPVEKKVAAYQLEGTSFTEMPNVVFAGTHVAAGTGKAVVFATGMDTEFGKIANLTQEVVEELSPLQKEMKIATRIITFVALGVGAIFFVLAFFLGKVNAADSFIFTVGMVVAFVPEGMLPLVTLSLAMGSQRMAKRNALIKKLSAVETLGCTTVICTDKTGTLTQNEMTVRNLWIPCKTDSKSVGKVLKVTGNGYAPVGRIFTGETEITSEGDSNLRALLLAAGLCNNSKLLPPNGDGKNRWTILGDPTEAALLVVARESGIDLATEEEQTPRLRELPFESRRKRMSTIHNLAGGWRSIGPARREMAYVKGAPKEMLDLSSTLFLAGKSVPLSVVDREQIMAVNDEFARDGLRVLAIAQRELPAQVEDFTPEIIEKDLTFLGLIAMMDPPRPEVSKAVEECHTAGIRVVMITGDYGLTADSIARRIGIIKTKDARIVSGFELESMNEEDLLQALDHEVIFARVAPEHKLRVVSALQTKGNVVAVTGDGVNDAPALKKADIGVAMGITGTDVAKEAASMILTDDNFASIVNAVEEGRAVYANIRKFCSYIFTSNTPEALPFIFFVLSGGRIPLALTVMEILSIDLGTDMVPALGLGVEPPEPGLMKHLPRSLKSHVIDRSMLFRTYGYLGIPQALITMIAFFYMYWTNGYWGQFLDLPSSGNLYLAASSLALASVVFTQIGAVFTQRTEKTSILKIPLFNNRLILIGILSELVLVGLIVYTPFLNAFIGTGPFPPSYWLFLVPFIPVLIIIDEVAKFFKRKFYSKKGAAL